MTLDQARKSIGRQVVYRQRYSAAVEQGEITSVNSTFVFVRYDGDQHAKATAASELELSVGGLS